MDPRDRVALASLSTALVVIVASSALFVSSPSAHLEITVLRPIRDVDGIGAASELEAEVWNAGDRPAKPSFWVVWSAFPRIWNVDEGPPTLPPGASATYRIRVSDIRMSVPNGTLFFVKVFDGSSGLYFRSETIRLFLTDSPPVLNPGLRFWSRDTWSGAYEPFAWRLNLGQGVGDAASAEPESGLSGLWLRLQQDGGAEAPLHAVAAQEVSTSHIRRLEEMSIAICWTRAIDFSKDPVSNFPIAASGIELAGSERLAWMVLAPTPSDPIDLEGHRIFIVKARTDRPGCADMPLGSMLDYLAGGSLGSISLRIFAAIWPTAAVDADFRVTSLVLG